SPEKLNPRDFRLIWLCVAVAAVSLWIATRFFFQVFPEASIQFNVNRESSLPVAEDLLRRLRILKGSSSDVASNSISDSSGAVPLDLTSYQHVAIFNYDDIAKSFLVRVLVMVKDNCLMGLHFCLWCWIFRWFCT